ncbi:hypothetical protein JCGZ_13684 [Jatropha curcas]|uniref:Uncharacterized protein n=1 Tax=Jatropha curcas TaxID=180498 RepID=A0A067KD07_JATCU|nr:hypothetical protein JCGZ_13684 [Jatropha curcas]
MDIPEKMSQYKYHLGIAIIASLVLSIFLYAAPRLVTILAYFWPLFASTTVFLVLIIAFGGVSPLQSDSAHAEQAGEGLLHYVAAVQPENTGEPEKYE